MRKLTYEEFSKRFNEVQKGKLILLPEKESGYKGITFNVKVRCPVHGTIERKAQNYLHGHGCRECYKESQKLTYEEFSKRFNEVQKGKLELLPEKESGYIDTKNVVKVFCPNHGKIEGIAYNYLRGKGCKICANEYLKLTYEEFSKKFNEAQEGKLELIPETELDYEKTTSIIRVKCPTHGTIKGLAREYLRGRGCPICQQGNMEKLVRELLEVNNIRFEQFYYGFDWLRFNPKSKQHLDFWLPDYNIAIEVQDAPNHLYDELCIKRDKNKLKLCKKHGVTLIYFSTAYFDFPYYVIKDTQELLNKIKENK